MADNYPLDNAELTPETREETFLDGVTELEPETRKEAFIAKIYDSSQVVPEHIETREEWFLNKAAEGGGGVTIEALSVTANGTYSEAGKAYSPVIVEVPAPTLITKTITENGTYTASEDNADGYSQVTVNVPYMEKKSASGDIASFSDGAGYPFLKVKANINPVQDLHGQDYPWVGGAGRNLFNMGSKVDAAISGVTYTSDDEFIILNGTKQGGGYADLSSLQLTLPAGTYYLKAIIISGNTSNTVELYAYDGSANITSTIIGTERTLTLESEKTFRFRFAIWQDGTVLNNYKIGIVISNTANIDEFYPYSNICPISGFTGVNVTVSPTTTEGSGTVYPISWQDEAGIVYGGYIDLVSGVLTVTKVGIAEYNGETLPSAWISDRDRYVAGNTPTIGAQVVYDLATPQTYQLTPQQINTLLGQNNAWNNTNGQTEVEYFIPIE